MPSLAINSTLPEAAPPHKGVFQPVTRVGLAVASSLLVAGVSLLSTHAIGNDPEAWVV